MILMAMMVRRKKRIIITVFSNLNIEHFNVILTIEEIPHEELARR